MRRVLSAWVLIILGAGPVAASCGFTDMGLSYVEACAIKASDSTVQCWGMASDGEDSPPAAAFNDICGDAFTMCGVKADGSLACWGSDSYVQLSTKPAGTSWSKVACAFGASCALKNDGTISCWGTYAPSAPVGTFAQLDGQDETFCGVKTDGSVRCWGSDAYDVISDKPAGTDWVEAHAWTRHACARKADGTLTCWGSNSYGEATAPGGTFQSVGVSGYDDSCGVTSSCTVDCWGCSYNGTDDDCTDYAEPSGTHFVQVFGSVNNFCALDNGGNVTCWNDDTFDIISGIPSTGCSVSACGGAAPAAQVHVSVIQ